MSEWNQKIIKEFRSNKGQVGGMFEGVTLALLTTTGARSGRRHTTPLTYLRDGERLLVFASNAGDPNHPAWYHNVLADPRVTIEVGTRSYAGIARPLRGEERDRMYALQSELVPAYADYQRQTARVIPVIALHDADRAGAIGDHLVQVHAELRGQLAAVRASLPDGGPVPELAAQLRTHCLTVCDALGEHHTNEDGVFPRLQGLFPGLGPTLDRLRREHVAVARLKDELRGLLDDPDRFRTEFDRMSAELEAHFAYEEEQLVAVLSAVSPAELR